MVSSDLERVRPGQHGRRDGDPNILPAALAISAAILYSSEPGLAAIPAASAFVLLVVNWLRRG